MIARFECAAANLAPGAVDRLVVDQVGREPSSGSRGPDSNEGSRVAEASEDRELDMVGEAAAAARLRSGHF
jgi:hypothetical protein